MKRTLSLLVVLAMVISMVPSVFAANDSVDFDDLIYLENYSPLTVNIEAGATEPVEFLWLPTEEGTLTYDLNDAETTVSIVLTQGENTATSEAGLVKLDVVAGEEVSIKISDTIGAAVENLVINGTFGKECAHVPGAPVQEDVVPATCTADGSYNSVVYCAECGEKMSSTAEVIPATDHAWDEGTKYPATTEKNAYTLFICGACGATKEEEEEGTQLPAFAITTQPTDQNNKLGEKATFTVKATGAVSYQWQRMKSGSTTWSNISGATGASYTVTVASYSVIPYRCVLKDAEGNELVTNAVTIILPEPLVNIMNVAGDTTLIKNELIHMTVELDSTEGVTYQWQRCKNGTTWTNVSYNGNKTNTVYFAATPYNQFPYRCEITDANGTKIYTGSYTFTLEEPPINPVIKTNPRDVYLISGGTATFSVVAEGSGYVVDGVDTTGLTYQWWRSKNDGETWGQYTGAGGQTSSISLRVYTGQEYLYMCEVKDGYGNTLKSRIVQPRVITAVKITSQPTLTVEEVDGVKTATFSFTATGDVRTYQWERYKTSGWVNANSSSYVGNDTTTMSTTVTGTFRCRITDLAGNVTYTNEVTFTK